MTSVRVAQRYAIAIYESAREADVLAQVTNDIQSLDEILRSSRELQLFFHSPVVSSDKKIKAIEEIFHDTTHPFTLRTILFLVQQQRENIIHDIIHAFIIILRRREGIQHAAVVTASPLPEDQRMHLQTVLQDITKRHVELGYATDPSIRGGMIIRMDDTVYDGSITNQLRLLRKKFSEAVTIS